MDFTRQPVIETVITAKEGCKLVVRNSKGTGQEEYFVDAVEVVSFGHSFFFRSQEKPKAFLVPATDYEVLEVREARMVLKNVGSNRSIKIAGGRAVAQQQGKSDGKGEENKEALEPHTEEKRRERRRQPRRRRSRDVENSEKEVLKKEEESVPHEKEQPEQGREQPKGKKEKVANRRGGRHSAPATAEKDAGEIDAGLSTSVLKSLLPPPSTLISDTIDKYKDNELFRDAFFEAEEGSEEQAVVEDLKEESSSSNS